MPRDRKSKKKNAGVGIDFKRAKHKVGKKLPRAQNATDTTIRSKAINLPEQSVTADKAGAVVSHRHLTLKELLGQCTHYSERVRLDALRGLAELIRAHPAELRRHAAAAVAAAAERVADADAACRTAALILLRSALLPALGPAAVQPYVPLLMAHVCAAMTHLAEPVRSDSLSFLTALAEVRPDLVAAGHLTQVLQHFGSVLSRSSRGRSLKAGSLPALLASVQGVQAFLARCLPALQPGGGARGGLKFSHQSAAAKASGGLAIPQPAAVSAAPAALLSSRCSWPAVQQASPQLGSLAAGSGPAATAAASPAAEAAARTLLGVLLECFSECGVAELEAQPQAQAAQCAAVVLAACDLLLGHWGAARLAGDPALRSSLAAALVAKVAAHFPLHAPSVMAPPAALEQLVRLNVAAAQVLARFLPDATSVPVAAAAAGGGGGGGGGVILPPDWVGRLLDWLGGVMAAGAVLPRPVDDIMGPAPIPQHAQQLGKAAPQAARGSSQKHAAGGAVQSGRGGNVKKRGRQEHSGGDAGSGPGSAGNQPIADARGAGNGHAPVVPAEVYGAVLDGARRILPTLPPLRRRALLSAAWALWLRSTPRSAARVRVLAFLTSVLSDPAGSLYTALPPDGQPLVLQEEAAQWVAAMPRFLWEVGAGAPPATHAAALQLMLDAARFAPTAGPITDALAGLPQQLAPLLCMLTPLQTPAAAGKRKKEAAAAKLQSREQLAGEVGGTSTSNARCRGDAAVHMRLGPLAALPTEVQHLAVDLLYHLPAPLTPLYKPAAALCIGDAYPLSTALRLLSVLGLRAGGIDPADPASAAYWGLLLTLIAGASTAGVERELSTKAGAWRRHETVAAAAVAAALEVATSPSQALQALGPPLLALCVQLDSSHAAERDAGGLLAARPLYGCLHLCLAAAEDSRTGGEIEIGLEELFGEQLVGALPGVMLGLVAACCQASAGDSQQQQGVGSEGLTPGEAACLAATLVAAAPALLGAVLPAIAQAGATAAAAASAVDAAAGAAAALLPAALLMLGLAQEERMAQGWGEHSEAAAAAGAALKAGRLAVEGAGGGQAAAALSPVLAQLAALLSVRLGQEVDA